MNRLKTLTKGAMVAIALMGILAGTAAVLSQGSPAQADVAGSAAILSQDFLTVDTAAGTSAGVTEEALPGDESVTELSDWTYTRRSRPPSRFF